MNMKIEEYWKKYNSIKERMFWVGCGTKEQAEEGFKLMREMSELNKKFLKESNNKV